LGFEYNGKIFLFVQAVYHGISGNYTIVYNEQLSWHIVLIPKAIKFFFNRFTIVTLTWGKGNFLTYAYNASKEFYETSGGDFMCGLNSDAIKANS
jgi:hypothetical protein